MGWLHYALAILLFNALGVLAVYALQRLQLWLPLNPQAMANVTPDSSFNTAVSFVTNTNWQGYGGESTMSYLTQMLALAVQNFFSAATGIVVVIALIRGFARHTAKSIGNAWVDLTRSRCTCCCRLSLVYAVFLVSQGVIQNFDAYKDVTTLEVTKYDNPKLGRRRPAAQGCQGQARDGPDKSADPDPADGAGGLAGSHQDARHQRRRLLQRQLGASLREPDAPVQFRADAVDLPDSRRRCASRSAAWSVTSARAGRCWRR